jgi:amino acid permease
LLEAKYPNLKEILHYLKTRKRIRSFTFPIQNLTMLTLECQLCQRPILIESQNKYNKQQTHTKAAKITFTISLIFIKGIGRGAVRNVATAGPSAAGTPRDTGAVGGERGLGRPANIVTRPTSSTFTKIGKKSQNNN